MSGTDNNTQTNAVQSAELTLVDPASTGVSQPSDTQQPSKEVQVNDRPLTHFVEPRYASFDTLVSIHTLQTEVPGLRALKVADTHKHLSMSDNDSRKKGWMLVGTGNGKFNPEDGTVLDAVRKDAELMDRKYMNRLAEDVRISDAGVNLPTTMLESVIEAMRANGADNLEVRKWLWPALDAIKAFEKGELLDFAEEEPNVIGFFLSWSEGQADQNNGWAKFYPPEIIASMRKQLELSLKTWIRNPTELAAAAHALYVMRCAGKEGDEMESALVWLMEWLSSAFRAMAAAQTAQLREETFIKSLEPITITAARFDRNDVSNKGSRDERPRLSERKVIETELKLALISGATQHTAYTARSFGFDIVAAIHREGGFGVSLKRATTKRLNLRNVARILRCKVLIRRNRAKEAFAMWNELGDEGIHKEVDGILFDPANKIVRNGAAGKDTVIADLPITRGDLIEAVDWGMHERRAIFWLLKQKRIHDPLPKRAEAPFNAPRVVEKKLAS